MTKEELEILESLPQKPNNGGAELHIGKNDPKNGKPDYWWCVYGDIGMSGFYSLPQMLGHLARECLRYGYIERENALIEGDA